MADQPDELINATLAGRYWVISQLGVGGMGVAYRAWDELQGLPVVVKIPKKSFLADPKFTERFRREIRLLQGLSHVHIVPIVDVGEHDGLPFVVMRFLPGGSLSNRRLRDEKGNPRPNPPEMLHLWLPAVAEALDFVHAQGVVHRDVKPANVFFDGFWTAYLGDFGIAKILSESDVFDREETLTGTNVGLGTVEYMAPEQFTPKAQVDGRADQYALAVIVYEMLSGHRPFRGENSHVVVEVLTQPAPHLGDRRPGLSAGLVEAVHRGLAKTAGQRFGTCREFAAAALADVVPMTDDPAVARLLCPKCNRILKLPVQAAGRQGNCRNCKARMMVAADLGALWLVDEQRHGEGRASDTGPQSTGLGSAAPDPFSSFQPLSDTNRLPVARRGTPTHKRRRRGGLQPFIVMAGLVAAAAISAVVTLSPVEPPPSNHPRPRPNPDPGKVITNMEVKKGSDKKGDEPAIVVASSEDPKKPQPPEPPPPEPPKSNPEDSSVGTKEGHALRGPLLEDLIMEPDPQPKPQPIDQKPSDVINSVGMRLKLLSPGGFQMGDPDGRPTEKPHFVKLTKPFFLGVHEVTSGQWQQVMGNSPSKFRGQNNPVEQVTWAAAVEFCQRLSEREAERAAGRVYRLPTSAEWEYACRAGTDTKYAFGNDDGQLADHAWVLGGGPGTTHPVGRKKPNQWGLFDMYGNVWEWCSDWRGPYDGMAKVDPKGPAASELSQRVLRGGCWETDPQKTPVHSGARLGLLPLKSSPGIGLRVACDVSESVATAATPGGDRVDQASDLSQ